MSSTGRKKKDGTTTARREADFYETPDWCVHALLSQPEIREFFLRPGLDLCEPCAGSGAIVEAFDDHFATTPSTWTMVELRKSELISLKAISPYASHYSIVCPQDILTWNPGKAFDACLTNPPFTIWEEVLEKTLELSPVSIMLLRQGVKGSEKRHDFWQRHRPMELTMSRRPSFTNDGKTDSSYYSWFCWGIGKQGTYRVI